MGQQKLLKFLGNEVNADPSDMFQRIFEGVSHLRLPNGDTA